MDDLFECYRKFSLSRGLIPQIGAFTQIKEAALSFFAAGMGCEMLDEDSTCGGGSFKQACCQKGFFKAAEWWGVDSEKPKLSIYFSTTRNTMSNERVLRTVERQNSTRSSLQSHCQREAAVLLRSGGPQSRADMVKPGSTRAEGYRGSSQQIVGG